MKKAWAIWGGLCVAVWPAMAQPVASASAPTPLSAGQLDRQAQRDRIHQERQAITAARKRDEAACYRRFAVEDCLREVRAKARGAELQLRAREVQLNDAQRKEKAAERLRAIEEKQRVAPDRSRPQGAARGVGRGAPASADDLRTQHQQDALRRAEQQRNRQQSMAANQAQRAKENADRAATARARHADNVKSAQERRERVQKMQAESAAAGRKPAAPLPVASAGAGPAPGPAKP